MALTSERKAEITAQMKVYLANNEDHTFNVMTLAWAYSCDANEITPLVRQWLKDGLIVVAYIGGANTRNYRSNVGKFASLLAAARTDEVARMAATDYLIEMGKERKTAHKTVQMLTAFASK